MGLQDRQLIEGRFRFTKRPLSFVVVLLGILCLNFVLIQLGGSGAVHEIMRRETRSDPEILRARIEAYREEQGLNEPIHRRLGLWLSNLSHFDFGRSMSEQKPVRDLVGPALERSLWLQVPAFMLVFLLGIPLGVYLALRAQRFDGRCLSVATYALLSIPTFWLASLLLIYLATDQGLDIFPLEGLSSRDAESLPFLSRLWDRFFHLVLPVLALSLPGAVAVARQVRQGMMEALESSHVLAARSLGISERRLVWVHALRQALVPVAVLFGLLLPTLVGGSVIVERIFSIQGLGSLLLHAVMARDMPLLQALVLLASVATLLGFVLADWLVSWIAPAARGQAA